MNISVVIPSYNEAESLPELCSWIDRVLIDHSLSYEVIIIDDGSTDNSWNVIKKISKLNKKIKGIRFRRNYGKSAALNIGFAKSEGNVVITMDADLQDSPDEIPELFSLINDHSWDMVSGWKKKDMIQFQKQFQLSCTIGLLVNLREYISMILIVDLNHIEKML